MSETIQHGKFVELTYKVTDKNSGLVLTRVEFPLGYVHGHNEILSPSVHKALEGKLFEDQKDSIKLTSLVSSVVDRDTQAKIDVVKQRLIKNFGYDEVSATDVLNFVASIFARGDAKE